jgi:hypothetical protein
MYRANFSLHGQEARERKRERPKFHILFEDMTPRENLPLGPTPYNSATLGTAFDTQAFGGHWTHKLKEICKF